MFSQIGPKIREIITFQVLRFSGFGPKKQHFLVLGKSVEIFFRQYWFLSEKKKSGERTFALFILFANSRLKIVVFLYISLLTLLPPLQKKTTIFNLDLAKNGFRLRKNSFAPLFNYFFLIKISIAEKKIQPICPEPKNVVFWAEARKA